MGTLLQIPLIFITRKAEGPVAEVVAESERAGEAEGTAPLRAAPVEADSGTTQ